MTNDPSYQVDIIQEMREAMADDVLRTFDDLVLSMANAMGRAAADIGLPFSASRDASYRASIRDLVDDLFCTEIEDAKRTLKID